MSSFLLLMTPELRCILLFLINLRPKVADLESELRKRIAAASSAPPAPSAQMQQDLVDKDEQIHTLLNENSALREALEARPLSAAFGGVGGAGASMLFSSGGGWRQREETVTRLDSMSARLKELEEQNRELRAQNGRAGREAVEMRARLQKLEQGLHFRVNLCSISLVPRDLKYPQVIIFFAYRRSVWLKGSSR